jgi:hypothetical protein
LQLITQVFGGSGYHHPNNISPRIPLTGIFENWLENKLAGGIIFIKLLGSLPLPSKIHGPK